MSGPPIKKQKFHKKKFYQPNGKQYLEVGHRGFLATCNFNEKNCVRECYNILNQYANEMYGVEDNFSKDNAISKDDKNTQQNVKDIPSDIADELEMQINASQLKTLNTKRRFQVVDTGVTNCVFIKTTLDDPKAVAEKIVADIAKTKQQKTRHLLRLLPIFTVCKANEKDIIKSAGELCDKFFLKEHTTFSIVYNKRFNNGINRDDLIREIADLIHAKNTKNKVDLKLAKRSLVVEVIKGLCCLTVVDNYMAMKKYNLVELARANHEYNTEKPTKDESVEGNEETSALNTEEKGGKKIEEIENKTTDCVELKKTNQEHSINNAKLENSEGKK